MNVPLNRNDQRGGDGLGFSLFPDPLAMFDYGEGFKYVAFAVGAVFFIAIVARLRGK
jgi:hypothetical protein